MTCSTGSAVRMSKPIELLHIPARRHLLHVPVEAWTTTIRCAASPMSNLSHAVYFVVRPTSTSIVLSCSSCHPWSTARLCADKVLHVVRPSGFGIGNVGDKTFRARLFAGKRLGVHPVHAEEGARTEPPRCSICSCYGPGEPRIEYMGYMGSKSTKTSASPSKPGFPYDSTRMFQNLEDTTMYVLLLPVSSMRTGQHITSK
jgi:hypothetical protein